MKEYFEKYFISDVSRIFNVSSGLIRHYEKIGLIEPLKENTNNYRLYNIHVIEQLSNIILFRSLELSLDDINSIQSQYDNDIDQVINILDNHEEEIEEKIAFLKAISQQTAHYKNELKKIKPYINKIVVKESPELIFTSLNTTLNIKDLASNYYKLLSEFSLFPKYAFIMNTEKLMNKEDLLNCPRQFGVCVEKNEAFDIDGITFPSKTCAYSIYIGDILSIDTRYQEMISWINEHNYYPSGDAFEVGLLCIGNKYIVDIYIPIKPKE